ncbi:hypothetical protein [Pelagibius marinus]|uniref:hypothetical protein n=1 Tax=Pelagibius marinus TaxID=2762760 RepID=UPI001872CC9C|nr:hypothetical protein [Pelagibius marinus]
MATPNCPSHGPRDSLSRDGLIPIPYGGDRLAFRMALGALAGLLLALAASLSPEEEKGAPAAEPLRLPGSATVPELP